MSPSLVLKRRIGRADGGNCPSFVGTSMASLKSSMATAAKATSVRFKSKVVAN